MRVSKLTTSVDIVPRITEFKIVEISVDAIANRRLIALQSHIDLKFQNIF